MSFLGFGGPDDSSQFNENKYNPNAQQGRDQVRSASGPDFSQDQQGRQGQLQLAQLLNQQAMGGGPNPAALQFHQAAAQNAANAMALAASGRGNQNAGMSGYYAGQQMGAGNQGAAAEAARLRLAQMLNAQGGLGSLFAQMRGADQSAAGVQLQNNQFNTGAYNQQLAQDMNAQNAMQQLQNQQIGQRSLSDAQWLQQFTGQLIGGLGSGAGSGLQSAMKAGTAAPTAGPAAAATLAA